MSTRRDHPSYSRKRGAIKVYASVVSPEVEPRSFIVTNQTTTRELVSMVLNKYKITTLDPNLFYLTLEIGSRNPGLTAKQVIPLEDNVRPLEIQSQYPRRQSRFCLQMKNGGVIKVHDNSILPGLFNKSLFISTKTTAREVVQLLLRSYKPEEDPNDFYLCEVDSEEYDTHILQPHDCPLVIQEQWLHPDHHYFQLLPYEDRPAHGVRKSRSLTSLIDIQHSNPNFSSGGLNSDNVKLQRSKRIRIKSAGSTRSQGSAPAATTNPSNKTINKIRSSLHQLQHELRLSLESLDKAVSETEDYDGGESSLSVDTTQGRRRSYSGISDLDAEEYSQRIKQWSHQAAMHHNYSDSESYTTDSSMGPNESQSRRLRQRNVEGQHSQSEQLILNLQKEILTSLTDDQSEGSYPDNSGNRQRHNSYGDNPSPTKHTNSPGKHSLNIPDVSSDKENNTSHSQPETVSTKISDNNEVSFEHSSHKISITGSSSVVTLATDSQLEDKCEVITKNVRKTEAGVERAEQRLDETSSHNGINVAKDLPITGEIIVEENKNVSLDKRKPDHTNQSKSSIDTMDKNELDLDNDTVQLVQQKSPRSQVFLRASPQNSVSDGNLSDTSSVKSFPEKLSKDGKNQPSGSPSVNTMNEAVAQIYRALVHDARKKKQAAVQNKPKQPATISPSANSVKENKSNLDLENSDFTDNNNKNISKSSAITGDSAVSVNNKVITENGFVSKPKNTDIKNRHESNDIIHSHGEQLNRLHDAQYLGHTTSKSIDHLHQTELRHPSSTTSHIFQEISSTQNDRIKPDINGCKSSTSVNLSSLQREKYEKEESAKSTPEQVPDEKVQNAPAPQGMPHSQITKNQVTKQRKSSISSVESFDIDKPTTEKSSVSGSRPESACSTNSEVFRSRYLAPTTRRRRMLPKIPDAKVSVMEKSRVLSASALQKLQHKDDSELKKGEREHSLEQGKSLSVVQRDNSSNMSNADQIHNSSGQERHVLTQSGVKMTVSSLHEKPNEYRQLIKTDEMSEKVEEKIQLDKTAIDRQVDHPSTALEDSKVPLHTQEDNASVTKFGKDKNSINVFSNTSEFQNLYNNNESEIPKIQKGVVSSSAAQLTVSAKETSNSIIGKSDVMRENTSADINSVSPSHHFNEKSACFSSNQVNNNVDGLHNKYEVKNQEMSREHRVQSMDKHFSSDGIIIAETLTHDNRTAENVTVNRDNINKNNKTCNSVSSDSGSPSYPLARNDDDVPKSSIFSTFTEIDHVDHINANTDKVNVLTGIFSSEHVEESPTRKVTAMDITQKTNINNNVRVGETDSKRYDELDSSLQIGDSQKHDVISVDVHKEGSKTNVGEKGHFMPDPLNADVPINGQCDKNSSNAKDSSQGITPEIKKNSTLPAEIVDENEFNFLNKGEDSICLHRESSEKPAADLDDKNKIYMSHSEVTLNSSSQHLNDSSDSLPVYLSKQYQELPSLDMNENDEHYKLLEEKSTALCADENEMHNPPLDFQDSKITQKGSSDCTTKETTEEEEVLLLAPSGFEDSNDTVTGGLSSGMEKGQTSAFQTTIDISKDDEKNASQELVESVLNGTFTLDDDDIKENANSKAIEQVDSDGNSAVTETITSSVLSDLDKMSETNSEDSNLSGFSRLKGNNAPSVGKSSTRSRSMSDPNICATDVVNSGNKKSRVKSANQLAGSKQTKSKPKVAPKPKPALKPKPSITRPTESTAAKNQNKKKDSEISKRPRSHSDAGISISQKDLTEKKTETSKTGKKETLKTNTSKKLQNKENVGKTVASKEDDKSTSTKKKTSTSTASRSKTVFRDPQSKKSVSSMSSKSNGAKPQIMPKPGRKPKLSWTEQHVQRKNAAASETQSFPFTNFVLGHDPKPLIRTQESMDSTASELERLMEVTHPDQETYTTTKSAEDPSKISSSVSSEIANSVDNKMDTITEDHLKNWEAVQHEVHSIGFHAIDFENKSRTSSFSDLSEPLDSKSQFIQDTDNGPVFTSTSSFDKYLTPTEVSKSCTSITEVDLVFSNSAAMNGTVYDNGNNNHINKTSTPKDLTFDRKESTIKQHASKVNQLSLFQILRLCDLIAITLINTTVDGSYPLRLKLFENEFVESGSENSPAGSQRDKLFQSPSGRKPLLGGKGSAFTPVKPKKQSTSTLVCVETVVLLQANRDGEKLLQEGDYLVEVNGVEVISHTLEETQAELERSGDTVNLVVARPKPLQNNTTMMPVSTSSQETQTEETQNDDARENSFLEREKEAEERYNSLERDLEIWKEEYKHLKLQILEKDSLITDLSNALAAREGNNDAALEEIPEEDEQTDEEEIAYI